MVTKIVTVRDSRKKTSHNEGGRGAGLGDVGGYGRTDCRSARRNSRNTWSNGGNADIWLASRADHRAFRRASFFMMASWIPAACALRKASFAAIAGTK